MKPLSLIVALLLFAFAVRAEELSIGRFEVSWEGGWSLISKTDPVRYAGPGPTGVTIDLLDHGEMNTTQQKAEKEKWSRYAKEELTKLALRHGAIVVPFKEEKLDSGYTLFSVATARKQDGTDYFGLVFVSVSPEGRVAQFAVEGFGDAKTKFPTFHNFMLSGRWKTEPSKALGPTTMAVTPPASQESRQP